MIIPGSVHSLRYISVSLLYPLHWKQLVDSKIVSAILDHSKVTIIVDTSFVSLSVLVIFDYIGFTPSFHL